MPSVAVTGASGFIGRRLIERLCQDGYSVRALARKRPVQAASEGGDLTIIEGALGDDASIADLIDGVDAVIHLAGLIKARSRSAFFEANAAGVAHLAGLMSAAPKPAKLVLASSLAAREPELSSYAASKRGGEEALEQLGDALPWTILRPPAVYGPGDRETLAFFKGMQRGIGAMLGGEDARFSLLHVDDLTAAFMTVIDPGVADGMVLELDDGKEGGHGWHGMISAAERAFDRKALRFYVPALLLKTLGHVNAGLRILPGYTPMLTPEKVREITHPDWVVDRSTILEATEWRPAMPIDRGFSATIEWYQLHKWL